MVTKVRQVIVSLPNTNRPRSIAKIGEIAMIGILPTLVPEDLTLENMTPISRYYALNEAMRELRATTVVATPSASRAAAASSAVCSMAP